MVHPGKAARALQKDPQLQLQRRSRELIVFDSLCAPGPGSAPKLQSGDIISQDGLPDPSVMTSLPLDDQFLDKARSNSLCEMKQVEKLERSWKQVEAA